MSIVLASCVLAVASANALNGVSPVTPQAVAAVVASNATGTNFGYIAPPGRVRIAKTYYSNHTHDNVNGKVWVSDRVYIGPGPSAQSTNCEVPGPGYYGVPEDDNTRILVRVGMTSFGISPWQRIEGRALHRLEAARQCWLNSHGYGSGVRTFVNDANVVHTHDADHAQAEPLRQLPPAGDEVQVFAPTNVRDIQPRATIRIPSDMPRFRKRMDVRNNFNDGILVRRGRQFNVASVNICQPSCTGAPEVRTISGRGNSWGTTIVMPRNSTVAMAK